MRKKYKHEYGIVLDDDKKVKIHFSQLIDEGIRIKYKDKDIFDENEEYRLFIRSRGDSSHFYSRGVSRKDIRSKVYETELHKETVNNLVSFFSNRNRVRILYYYWEKKNRGKETIISIKDYLFYSNVKRVCSETNYVVFDIFGNHNSLSTTEKKPEIAIEVIDSHFCDFQTFNLYLEMSKQKSFIVLFYYAKEVPIKNTMKKIGENDNGELRIFQYIQDGSFWIGDDRIEEKSYAHFKNYKTETDFENPQEYYNAVIELEVQNLLKS